LQLKTGHFYEHPVYMCIHKVIQICMRQIIYEKSFNCVEWNISKINLFIFCAGFKSHDLWTYEIKTWIVSRLINWKTFLGSLRFNINILIYQIRVEERLASISWSQQCFYKWKNIGPIGVNRLPAAKRGKVKTKIMHQ
jgi:hypothetical protein